MDEMEELFGMRDSASRRGSIASDSDRGAISESDDDGGRNNPMEEAMEVPGPEAEGQQEATPKVVKPRRVVKNPMPKIDMQRVAGPRGIPTIQKFFKHVKFQGKGHEKEDLDVLLKHLEHWAHRLMPKYPFFNVLQQLEKFGNTKSAKVMMKKYRLDMFQDHEVQRGVDGDVILREEEDENPEPVVDVFDELLGPAFPSSNQSTVIPPKPKQVTLTAEQRERVERNKRLAEERRLARMRAQQNSEADISNVTGNTMNNSDLADDDVTRRVEANDLEVMEIDGNSEQNRVTSTLPQTSVSEEQNQVTSTPPQTSESEEQNQVTSTPPQTSVTEEQNQVASTPPQTSVIEEQNLLDSTPPQTSVIEEITNKELEEPKTNKDNILTASNAANVNASLHPDDKQTGNVLEEKLRSNSEETAVENCIEEHKNSNEKHSTGEPLDDSKEHGKENLYNEEDMLDMLENDL